MNKNVIVLLFSICCLSPGLCANTKDSLQSDLYNRIHGKWKLYSTVYKPGLKKPGFSILNNEPTPVAFKQKGDTVSLSSFDTNFVTYIFDIKIYKDSIQLTSSDSIKTPVMPEGTYYFRLVEKHQSAELLLTNDKSSIVYVLRKPITLR